MSKVRVLESKTDMSSSDEETASTSCCGCSDSIQPPKSEETDVEIHGSLVDFADELKSFYNNPTMSDIILKVGNLSFYAHKFMLAKSSDVLQTMLTSSNWGESQQCEVRLEESEECSEKFAEFLQFIYCGKVKFSIQSVLPLLFLADKYNVVDLRTYCSQYMTSKVEKRSVKGAMRWLSYARKFDLDNLSGKCLEVILSQLDSVITTEEWLGLDVDFVCEILQSSDLVVQDEFTLFMAIQKWLLAPERESEVEDLGKRVMQLIRFSQIDPQKLYKIEESDLMKKLPDIVKEHISKAYRFHALVQSMRQEFQGEEHLPRCYSSPLYCHLQRDTVSLGNNRRPDRHNMLWEVHVVPPHAFSGQSESRKSRTKIWMGLCQVSNTNMLLRLFPNEDHIENRYKVYVLAKARDGSSLGVYRQVGVVQRGPVVQVYQHGESMVLPRGPRGLHPRSMMFSHDGEGWEGPPICPFGSTMAVKFDPIPKHKQYPYGGIESLRSEQRSISLPGTAPVVINIDNIDAQVPFNVSIGVHIIG